MTVSITISPSGAVGQTLQEINTDIIASATALSPGLVANLPGTLIEDISSTDTAAVFLCQQAQIETIASVSPYAANEYILTQLGNVYGVQQGVGSNTSVYVTFSGTPGYIIPQGVIVSDGSYRYITQDASVINSGGISATVYCVATVGGSWAVPAYSVTIISSAVPTGVTLTVTNPSPGIPSTTAQTASDFRDQVLQAGLVSSIGIIPAIKSALQNVTGVVSTLISIRENTYYVPPRWEVIVGGGDPYEVANAIWTSCGDPGVLCGSTMLVQNIVSQTITTNLVTNFTIGETVYVTGVVGLSGINGVALTITDLPTPYSFTVSNTFTGSYISGGIVSTSSTSVTIPRNNTVTIYDAPDSYNIPYVIPIQQPVTVVVTWNTSSSTIITSATIAALSAAPLQAYINGLGPGQTINEYEMQYLFQEAVVSILPTQLITHIAFSITINSVIVAPIAGTGVVVGDPEGYYYVSSSGITFVQG